MIWYVQWAKVTFQPLYSDARFQPADKLHVGCSNSADVLFSPQGQKVTEFKLVLYYNPETVEILRILPSVDNGLTNSKIEYNKIILDVKNPTFTSPKEATSFFHIYFKSAVVGKETITLGTGSEFIVANTPSPMTDDFTLEFAQVPECEPDIVPPSINLIYPKDTQQKIALDQYFIFDIKDIGKGVDKNSVTIYFDGTQYFYGSDSLKRNGNYLTFYPSKWIPIDVPIDLKIMITDKQSYGWANKTQSIYSFKTATGMLFNKDITPMIFRQIAQEAEKISASATECALLGSLYTSAEVIYQGELKSIIQKVWCDLTSIDTSLLVDEQDSAVNTDKQQRQYRNISVFATVGWLLFFITFMLKIHYLVSYKKHKKLYTDSQTFKIKN